MTPTTTPAYAPTPAGYLLMTQMAATVINTMNLKLAGGYLQNVQPSMTGTLLGVVHWSHLFPK